MIDAWLLKRLLLFYTPRLYPGYQSFFSSATGSFVSSAAGRIHERRRGSLFKTWPRPETAHEKPLVPRVPHLRRQVRIFFQLNSILACLISAAVLFRQSRYWVIESNNSLRHNLLCMKTAWPTKLLWFGNIQVMEKLRGETNLFKKRNLERILFILIHSRIKFKFQRTAMILGGLWLNRLNNMRAVSSTCSPPGACMLMGPVRRSSYSRVRPCGWVPCILVPTATLLNL